MIIVLPLSLTFKRIVSFIGIHICIIYVVISIWIILLTKLTFSPAQFLSMSKLYNYFELPKNIEGNYKSKCKICSSLIDVHCLMKFFKLIMIKCN